MQTTTIIPTAADVDAQVYDNGATSLATVVAKLTAATVDAIGDTRSMKFEPTPGDDLPVSERVRLVISTPRGANRLSVLDGAHRQFAYRTGIPWKYYERMLGGQPALLSDNLNTWLAAEPASRLLRMLKPMSGDDEKRLTISGTAASVRALLSDRFRPLDHHAVLRELLPVITEARARVREWSLNDERLFVRFVTDAQTIRALLGDQFERWAIETGGGRMAAEMLAFGATVQNSETGHSSLSVAPFVDVRGCTNVLQITERLRVVHIGRSDENGNEDGGYFDADTRRLDQAAQILKVRDRTRYIFQPGTFEEHAKIIGASVGVPIETPEKVALVDFVGNIGLNLGLTEDERTTLKDEFVEELGRRQGVASRFVLSQALTATAKHVKQDDYQRALDLEESGWRVLKNTATELLKLGAAGRN